ncbi:MAG TPA: class I SAM-dependent methyltransferase [Pirellulales bacterium]|nr:class I SAM-dependent methyltransferase [Pirellulales bacterium]
MSYHLPSGYQHRANPVPHDDSEFTDEWQDEVYAAASLCCQCLHDRPTSVLDLGCGSAFKLLKHFSQPHVGVEVAPMIGVLRFSYPDMTWRHFDEGPTHADVVICADVIEHVADPDQILSFIEGCTPRLVFLSTPDRDLVGRPNGPPENKSHVREWTFAEFDDYLMKRGWLIIEHYHSSRSQGTQLAVCEAISPDTA